MNTNTRIILAGSVALFGAACGSPQGPATQQGKAPEVETVQLGGAATGAGTLTADSGEYQPADPSKFHKEPGYSPYAGRNYPERPYFGDEHVHTAWSADAGGVGHDARTRGSHAVRARRRGDLHQRPAGQARHAARLGGDLRSLGRHGRDHRDQGRQSGDDGRPHAQALARHVCRRPGRSHEGHDGADRRAGQQEAAAAGHGSEVRQDRLAEEHRHRGEVQRAGALHGVHRLRVDVQRRRRRQPAPQRDLPRRQGQGRPGAAVHHLPEREPRRPVEVDGRLGEEDRRQAAGDSAQRQPVQRPDVRADDIRRQPDDQGVGRGAPEVGAAVRSHPDEGPERVASVAFDHRRVRRGLRALGPRQPDAGAQEARR